MLNQPILKPDVRFQYLNRRVPEKVTYLEIPSPQDIAALDKDIKNGAVQYKEIRDYLKKESSSNYIVISTDNKEHGYMAIMYLEAEFLMKEQVRSAEERLAKQSAEDKDEDIDYDTFEMMEDERFSDEEDYYFDEECYCENSFQIPIINLAELNQYVNKSRGNYIFGGLPMQWDQEQHNAKPYWTGCKEGAVCILCENLHFGGYGMELEGATDALSFFEDNKRVYILFVDEKAEEQFFDEEELPFVDNDFSGGNALKNEVVLNYTADELQVYLPEEYKKQYYKHLLRGFFKNYNITVKKGFSYDKIVNLILSITKKNICQRMDKVVKYAIKDKNKDNFAPIQLTNEDFKFIDKFTRTAAWNKQSKGKARDRLNNELIGMEHIKEQVCNVVNVMKFNRMREKMNIHGGQYHNVHVMLGAPGTAKTTVAELMGQIMVEEKLLPDNRFICVNGAELKGMYVGHSAPKTKALFDNYDVIVIDEAYSLVDDSGSTDSFSKEAIAQMIIELEKHSTDKLVIFAGYGGKNISDKNNKMRAFIDANPGIKSRITSTFQFDSYSPEEMVQIFYRIAKLKKYIVAPEAGKELAEYFSTRVSADNFGNGREARSLLETAVLYTAKRVFAKQKAKYSRKEMQQIAVEDIKAAICEVKCANQAQDAANRRFIGFY